MKSVLVVLSVLFSLSLRAQTIVGKTYKAEVSVSCKLFADGGCMLYAYTILKFKKDSVEVSYERIANCTPKERNALYENATLPPKNYKWSLNNGIVDIDGFNDFKELTISDNKLTGTTQYKSFIQFKELTKNKSNVNMPTLNQLYFPLNTENKPVNVKLDTFQNKWYSKHFFSLKEPILYKYQGDSEIYRYTNLGTWDNPFTYKVVKTATKVTITKKRTDGQGGYAAGKLVYNEVKEISLKEWENFNTKINNISFWKLPTHDELLGHDGSEWILEGYKNGKYHFVTRWTPDSYGDKNFVATCNHFEKIFNNSN